MKEFNGYITKDLMEYVLPGNGPLRLLLGKTSLYVWKRIAIYDVNEDVPSRIVNSLYAKTKYQTGTYNMHNNKKAEITCVLRHIVDKLSFAFNW